MTARPLIGLAMVIASVTALATGCGSSDKTANATYATASDVVATEATATDAETSGATSSIGAGIDQTCEDIVRLFAFGKDVDIVRGGNSVSDVEKIAAMASELARNAPAEPSTSFLEGEPRESLESIVTAYGTYLDVLSEGNLEPGPDAILEPRISDAMEGLSIDISVGLAPWIDARCSADVKNQLQQLGS